MVRGSTRRESIVRSRTSGVATTIPPRSRPSPARDPDPPIAADGAARQTAEDRGGRVVRITLQTAGGVENLVDRSRAVARLAEAQPGDRGGRAAAQPGARRNPTLHVDLERRRTRDAERPVTERPGDAVVPGAGPVRHACVQPAQ